MGGKGIGAEYARKPAAVVAQAPGLDNEGTIKLGRL
jgi:hypothetical protein